MSTVAFQLLSHELLGTINGLLDKSWSHMFFLPHLLCTWYNSVPRYRDTFYSILMYTMSFYFGLEWVPVIDTNLPEPQPPYVYTRYFVGVR